MKQIEEMFAACASEAERVALMQDITQWMHDNVSPFKDQPIGNVRWVPVEQVFANDYNPNSVAGREMGLLYTSIKHDGYTQPVVTIWDEENSRYVLELPCGHRALCVNGEPWNLPFSKSRQIESLAIPLVCSTVRGVSTTPLTPSKAGASSESKSHSQLTTEAKTSSTGVSSSGVSVGCVIDPPSSENMDGLLFGLGTLTESEKPSTSSLFCCPCCASKDEKRSKPWTVFTPAREGTAGESGLMVSCLTSEITEHFRLTKLPSISTDQSVPSGQSGSSLESLALADAELLVHFDGRMSRYVIVDGFHRYTTMRRNSDIRNSCHGLLPVVVLKKSINDRMASTVRHNRARGKHSVAGMGNMVFEMLENGWEDAQICAELGMEADELIRLKHITGFSKLFEDVEYRKAWETRKQLQIKKDWKDAHPGEPLV